MENPRGGNLGPTAGGAMVWVVVGLVLLFLMLRFPAFGGLVIIAAACGGMYLYVDGERQAARENRERDEAMSPTRISSLKFSGDGRLFLDGYLSKLTGTVTNTSTYMTTRKFRLKVLVYDCPVLGQPGCTVVGEDERYIYEVIPPQQKRSFNAMMSFSGLPTMAPEQWSWTFILQEVWTE